MPLALRPFSRMMFTMVRWAARRGLADTPQGESGSAKQQARRTGVRGETFAYWYLRRQGYVFVARNYTARGMKGEIDLVGYDGPVLAFVEVKTRTAGEETAARPEDAVTPEKRRHLARIARQFLYEWRVREAAWRFDVVAIESRPGRAPEVRLHKGAFGET
ncbi:MAG TPA: YraN family protein [Candidatus Acidoferrales bacterium]